LTIRLSNYPNWNNFGSTRLQLLLDRVSDATGGRVQSPYVPRMQQPVGLAEAVVFAMLASYFFWRTLVPTLAI
jgi:hypothetical protein